jgi:hypothetical protein
MSKLLSILAVLCLHAPAWGELPRLSEPVVIFLRNTAVQPSGALADMRGEVVRLLAPAGVALEWRSAIVKGEHFEHLLTVDFRGSCIPEPLYRAGIADVDVRKLASAAVSDNVVLPFASVECDAIRKVLGPSLSAASSAVRAGIMGKALGRVVAHEVYHMMTRSRAHSTTGAGKACFGLSDLTAAHFTFDNLNLAQLRPATPVTQTTDVREYFDDFVSGR